MNFNKKAIAELIIILLISMDILLLLSTIFYKFPQNVSLIITYFDLIVCSILAIEFVYKMKNSKDRKQYVKTNWLYIIAMFPDYLLNGILITFGFSGATGLLRLLRLVRVGRVLILFRKNIKLFTNFIKETYLDKLLIFVVILIIASSVGFTIIDKSATTIGDGLWYVLVTLATVGYGDIVPASFGGRIIGIILILGSALAFSTLTGAMSSIHTKRIEKDIKSDFEHRLEKIEEKLDELQLMIIDLKNDK